MDIIHLTSQTISSIFLNLCHTGLNIAQPGELPEYLVHGKCDPKPTYTKSNAILVQMVKAQHNPRKQYGIPPIKVSQSRV